jgi:hypothetical protein
MSETYLLIANVGETAATADVRVYFADREPAHTTVTVEARSRLTLALTDLLSAVVTPGQRTPIGLRIDALSPDARLYAEQAVYGTPAGGRRWARGSAHRASR